MIFLFFKSAEFFVAELFLRRVESGGRRVRVIF